MSIQQDVTDAATRARVASRALALASRAQKDAALTAMADALHSNETAVLAANAEDVERAEADGANAGIVDRLRLDPDRITAMAEGLREVAGLPDPVGEVVRGGTLPNGLELRQVRVPFGVVGMIYEARPNVTVDAAGICLKSGNAVLLRGQLQRSLEQRRHRRGAARGARRRRAAGRRGPAGARRLPRERQGADACPRPGRRADPARRRGPDPLGRRGVERAGDRDGRRQLPRLRRRARPTSRWRSTSCSTPRPTAPVSATPPSRCWCTRTVAEEFLPRVAGRPARRGRRRCTATRRSRRTTGWYRRPRRTGAPSTSTSTSRPPSSPTSTPRSSTSPAAAAGTREAIVTGDLTAARRFAAEVDAAAVVVNASTRFTDGGRVRVRRRDRHLDPEAARPRTDGADRDDLDEVRRHGRRSRALTREPPGRVPAMSIALVRARCRGAASMLERGQPLGRSGRVTLLRSCWPLLVSAARLRRPAASTADRAARVRSAAAARSPPVAASG